MTAKQLKEIRMYLEVTQAELAAQLGVSVPYISRMEAGHKPVSDRVRIGISKHYELNDHYVETMERARKLAD
ncbi:putative transcriptional regulator [Geomicrobium halophilum]|uniref:Putative transcriptional regulator n=1 Tax=Geomicrobium halophilum TaxID=549000 RepID=A0A841PZ38_9BACL|nr:helix-turn-helix transcriptional regulator [Geomicrobium halophilum]MBB6449605.1 putative transcriptional regulator [Geomicrobium halophilum]